MEVQRLDMNNKRERSKYSGEEWNTYRSSGIEENLRYHLTRKVVFGTLSYQSYL